MLGIVICPIQGSLLFVVVVVVDVCLFQLVLVGILLLAIVGWVECGGP